MSLNTMDAVSAAAAIRERKISAEALVGACLDHIEAVDGPIQAWAYIDPEYALEQARAADALQQSGQPLGPLHGLPVAIKDIYDTADMPTENGTAIHAGRRPPEDAAAVALLRKAGAVIMGKTVTSELAVYTPGKTANPHDPRRTPGGSSSGSAAAVAALMVPLALGTQTNGSLIRPASYCGVYGFKPSYGLIPGKGILLQSRTLDQAGVFARTLADVALVTGVLIGGDDATAAQVRRDLAADRQTVAIARPRIAFIRSPIWENMSEVGKTAFEALHAQWNAQGRDLVRAVELPAMFASAHDWHRVIMESELSSCYESIYSIGKDRLSDPLREMIERGARYTAVEYYRAQNGLIELKREFETFFTDYDAILTPATSSAAPLGLASTGSPMFCTIWTLCGLPAISLPILEGDERMPMGAQLVARQGNDAGLLRIARWLAEAGRAA